MADIKLTQVKAEGGGTPIRGFQEFDELTPADFTFQGKRYLAEGLFEVDPLLIDTTIWNRKLPVPPAGTEYGELDVITNKTHTFKDGIQTTSGRLLASFSGSAVYSDDLGQTWTYDPAGMATNSFVTQLDDTRVIYASFGNATGIIYISPIGDDGLNKGSSITTGVGDQIEGILTDGTDVIVWGANGTWRRNTNTDLTTWTNVTGLGIAQATQGTVAYGNGIWIAKDRVGTGSDDVYVSNDGITFTQHLSAVGIASAENVLWFDPTDNTFRILMEISNTVWELFESTNGSTWTSAGISDYTLANAPDRVVVDPITGNAVMYGITSNPIYVSDDKGVTWIETRYLDSDTDNGVIVKSDGFVFLDNTYSLNTDNLFYAGIYVPLTSNTATDTQVNRTKRVRIS